MRPAHSHRRGVFREFRSAQVLDVQITIKGTQVVYVGKRCLRSN